MWEILTYDFMIRAFAVGIGTAITTAILGNFVVASRQSVMSDMLAHTALAGVGIGIFLEMSPSLWAIIFSVGASIVLWFLTRQDNRAPEAIAMLLLSGGLALALLFAHLAKNNPISFETFLFGSILTITTSEMILFSVINFLIIIILLTQWRTFITLAFDTQFAQIQSRTRATSAEITFMIIIGLIVGMSLKIIGGLLVGAMLVIPTLCAHFLAKSFRANVLWSIGYNIIGVVLGITLSFYLDIPASSAIVLSLITFFILTSIFAQFAKTTR